jgi:hypothetical protein
LNFTWSRALFQDHVSYSIGAMLTQIGKEGILLRAVMDNQTRRLPKGVIIQTQPLQEPDLNSYFVNCIGNLRYESLSKNL